LLTSKSWSTGVGQAQKTKESRRENREQLWVQLLGRTGTPESSGCVLRECRLHTLELGKTKELSTEKSTEGSCHLLCFFFADSTEPPMPLP
jgi:hypothetical protein